jgi:hypothetical protein
MLGAMNKSKSAERLRIYTYLCPEHHVTYLKSSRRTGRPETTAVICKEPIANGKPCERFALFRDTPE